jgi:CobQ-like glutamine amidotransferase family enzyme
MASTETPVFIHICHLYPREMNIYGDHGNLLALKRRAEARGVAVRVSNYHPGQNFPRDIDLLLGGGGQDSCQLVVRDDLPRLVAPLSRLVQEGAAALMVCGMYQLFGASFRTATGEVIQGLGLLDLHTEAGPRRMIGNVTALSEEFGEVIGYENHSGRTWLAPGMRPFARARRGTGNNGRDHTEGARLRNVIGTYLHGPLLPKNTRIADYLIAAALEHRYAEKFELASLDDSLVEQARRHAKARRR